MCLFPTTETFKTMKNKKSEKTRLNYKKTKQNLRLKFSLL